MVTLGIDTSTERLSVSLIDEKKTLANYKSAGRLKHAALLAPAVKKCLANARKKAKEIELIALGIGPGSFTGLRVGVTFARALAIALGRPVIGVPTMDAIAHNGCKYLLTARRRKNTSRPAQSLSASSALPKICPVIDAKKNQVYASLYEISGGRVVRRSGYFLGPAEGLAEKLSGEILFLGDGAHLCKNVLSDRSGMKAEIINGKKWLPEAAVIAGIGLERFRKGRADDPYSLEPMYLYARDCNVNRGALRKMKRNPWVKSQYSPA